MKRRGSTFCRTEMSRAMEQFQPGDIVVPLFIDASHAAVHGVVTEVNPAEHKVYVNWAGVTLKQHDPDEIQPANIGKISGVRRMGGRKDIISADTFKCPNCGTKVLSQTGYCVKCKKKVKPPKKAGKKNTKGDEQFVGDPKTHGVKNPRPGGYTIVQNLVNDLSKENRKEIKKGPRTSARLKSRRGAYHVEKGRTYKRTRYEVDNDVVICPRCKGEAERQPFTKSTKIYVCPDCGWKITTDKLM